MDEVREIPIKKIKVGEYEQRIEKEDDGIAELSASIGRIGLVYPLIVHRDGDRLVLVEGHRRLSACRRLGLETVRCSVTDSGPDVATEIAFAGNFFRKELSPVELSCALKDCLNQGTMTVEELAAGFHRSQEWVHRMIAIHDWPQDILEAIHYERLSVSAAGNLACVTDDSYRSFLVRNAVEQGATARTTSAWLQAWRSMQPAEEAITMEPVSGKSSPLPAVPQAPCLCCSQTFPVNEMSHVPVCGACIQIIRSVGAAQVP